MIMRDVKTHRIKYVNAIVVEGEWTALGATGLLYQLVDHGFVPVLCCGVGREQLIAAYHPERTTIGTIIQCPRCSVVHTFQELPEPSAVLGGATRGFVRPDGTMAEPTIAPGTKA